MRFLRRTIRAIGPWGLQVIVLPTTDIPQRYPQRFLYVLACRSERGSDADNCPS